MEGLHPTCSHNDVDWDAESYMFCIPPTAVHRCSSTEAFSSSGFFIFSTSTNPPLSIPFAHNRPPVSIQTTNLLDTGQHPALSRAQRCKYHLATSRLQRYSILEISGLNGPPNLPCRTQCQENQNSRSQSHPLLPNPQIGTRQWCANEWYLSHVPKRREPIIWRVRASQSFVRQPRSAICICYTTCLILLHIVLLRLGVSGESVYLRIQKQRHLRV